MNPTDIKNIVGTILGNKAEYTFDFKSAPSYIPPKELGGDIDNQMIEIDGALTEFVIYSIFSSTYTLTQIFVLVNNTFRTAIAEYCRILNINPEDIIFVSKGGLILSNQVKVYMKKLPDKARVKFNQTYGKWLKRSDMDFSIIISKDLPNFDEVYNDMTLISFYLLDDMRKFIRQNIYDYSDYHKYNEKYQKYLLRNLRYNINKTEYTKKNMLHACKITYNGTENDEPCVRDVSLELDENFYDKFVTIINGKRMLFFPKKIGKYDSIQKNKDFTLNYNDALDFTNNGLRSKFTLIRMKAPFLIYYNNDELLESHVESKDSEHSRNIRSGEVIDVSVSHRDSAFHSKNFASDFTSNYFGNTPVMFYSLPYQIRELEKILFESVLYPWDGPKYEKRLIRYFMLKLIYDISEKNVDEITKILQTNKKIFQDIRSIIQNKNSPIDISNWNDYEILFNKVTFIVANGTDDLKFNEFLETVLKSLEDASSVMELYVNSTREVTRPTLSRQTSMFQMGGFNGCSKKKKEYFIPTLQKIFMNYSTMGVDTTIDEIFTSSFEYLIKKYNANNKMVQIFKSRMGKEIYNSDKNARPYMFYKDGRRVILRNNHLSFFSIIYLSFISEYFSFLILYSYGAKPNTETNQTNNNMGINWDLGRNKIIFRDGTFDTNIDKMLEEYCKDINKLYISFVVTLINNIIISLDRKIMPKKKNGDVVLTLSYQAIKNEMIPYDHDKIDKYSEHEEYNHMYHHWKHRIVELVRRLLKKITDSNLNWNGIDTLLKSNSKFEKKIIGLLNESIIKTIDQVVGKYGYDREDKYASYFADAGGLFTWKYMVPDFVKNKSKKHASCITSTILEMYLLYRIFENPFNVKCRLENKNDNGDPHSIWTYTQMYLGISLSHWVCSWDYTDENGNKKTHNFRGGGSEATGTYVYPLHKKQLLYAFIINPFESAIELAKSDTSVGNTKKETDMLIKAIDNIFLIIENEVVNI